MTFKKDLLDKIVSESTMFSRKKFVNDIYVYSYVYFDLHDYMKLIDKYGEYIIREIRGITIVGDKVFPSISKFFNIGENDLSINFDDLNDTIDVVEKIDGSLISPIIYNGEVLLKSKVSLNSRQSIIANKLIDNKQKLAIKELIEKYGIYPQFEYVSPMNKIVVDYKEDKLILTACRIFDGNKFDYIDYRKLKEIADMIGVDCVKIDTISKNDLEYIIENEEGIEGFVIYHNNYLYKIKTKWYMNLHKLSPDNVSNLAIFNMVIDEKIDDIISNINDNNIRNVFLEYSHKILEYLNNKYREFEHIRNIYNEMTPKDFALKYPEYVKYMKFLRKNKPIKDIVKEILSKEINKESVCIEKFGNIRDMYYKIFNINTFNYNKVRYNIFGSNDSSDVDIVVEYNGDVTKIASMKDMENNYKKYFEDKFGKDVDINFANIIGGTVINVYKSLPDMVNNAIFYTYDLHKQEFDKLVKNPINIDIVNWAKYKYIKTLTFFSRIKPYRKIIKTSLDNISMYDTVINTIISDKAVLHKYITNDLLTYKKVKPIDMIKKITFYILQLHFAYNNKIEIYTKRDMIDICNKNNMTNFAKAINRELEDNDMVDTVIDVLKILKYDLDKIIGCNNNP